MTDYKTRRKLAAAAAVLKSTKTTTAPGTGILVPDKKIVVAQDKGLLVPSSPQIMIRRDPLSSRFSNLLPDIEGIAEKILDSDLDHTQAIEVESKADDLVDWAPNVIIWCADRRFLGMKPFAKQAEVLLHLFEEFCPRCSDMNYLKDIPVRDVIETVTSKVALLEFGTCPHCGYTKARGRRKGFFRDPTELIAVFGQRSGKTALVSMAISYLVHRNASLTAPWKTYGLTPGQIIEFTIVATTVGQSEKTLWGTFKGMIENSHWFQQYKSVCNEEGKKHGVKETIKFAETFLWLGHKNMMIDFAANNPSGLRGTTRFGAAIDELGWFGHEDGANRIRSNGPETYAALNNACLSLRQRVDEEIEADMSCTWPMPMMFCISSPRAMNDAIMTLYRDQSSSPRTLRRHWATWEVHPKNTKAALAKLGELSKPSAARDYGAQPPITDDPLFPRIHIVTDAFKTSLAKERRYGPVLVPSALGFIKELDLDSGRRTLSYISAGLEETAPQPDLVKLKALKKKRLVALGPLRAVFEEIIAKPAINRPHIMGVDLGHTNNALAIVCGYLAQDGEKFVVDFALEIKPRSNRSVNLADVYEELIIKLTERLNVVAVFYDTWSSIHQIQDLAKRYGALGPMNSSRERRSWIREFENKKQLPPFIADQYSLNMADALMLVSRVEQGDCLFPALEVGIMELLVNRSLDPSNYPFAHLALQMSTVRARGRRLLKPVNGDDDLFRAWANAAVKAFTDELVIDLLMQDSRPRLAKNSGIQGYVALSSAGKGIKRSENFGGGAVSNTGTADFPVIIKHGTFRG